MVSLNIITGLLSIGLGLVVRKYPELIAGYNTMPKDQKERFNIEGYSLLMKKSFIIVGILIILFGAICKILSWPAGYLPSTLIPTLLLVLYLNIKAHRYKSI